MGLVCLCEPASRYNKSAHRAQHLAAAQSVVKRVLGAGGKRSAGRASKMAADEGASDGEDGAGGDADNDGADSEPREEDVAEDF